MAISAYLVYSWRPPTRTEALHAMGAPRATSLDTGKAAARRQSAPASARTFRVVSIDTAAVPRIAMSKQEAASALGVSIDFFDEHIVPDLRMAGSADGGSFRSPSSSDGSMTMPTTLPIP